MSDKSAAKSSGRAYGGVSAQVRRAERREKFLEAGLQIFGTQGYRAATVRGLCNEAGLTDRYFYESFKDMEDLLRAVYLQQMRQLHQALLQVAQHTHGDLAARIRLALNVFFEQMRDPRVARVTMAEVLGVSPAINALYQTNTQMFGALIIAQVKTELPQLKLTLQEERILGSALAGACAMSAAHWLLESYRTAQDSVVDACAMVMQGTLNELIRRL